MTTEGNNSDDDSRINIIVQAPHGHRMQVRTAKGDYIETTITSNVVAVDDWISKAKGTLFALETGWCPGRRTNSLASLLLLESNRCLSIQLKHLPYIADSLRSFCSDERNRFVGVEIHEDVKALCYDYNLEFIEDRLFGLEEMRVCLHRKDWTGHKDMVIALMGFYAMKIMDSRGHRMDFGWARQAPDALVGDATGEAYVSYTIGRHLVPEL